MKKRKLLESLVCQIKFLAVFLLAVRFELKFAEVYFAFHLLGVKNISTIFSTWVDGFNRSLSSLEPVVE